MSNTQALRLRKLLTAISTTKLSDSGSEYFGVSSLLNLTKTKPDENFNDRSTEKPTKPAKTTKTTSTSDAFNDTASCDSELSELFLDDLMNAEESWSPIEEHQPAYYRRTTSFPPLNFSFESMELLLTSQDNNNGCRFFNSQNAIGYSEDVRASISVKAPAMDADAFSQDDSLSFSTSSENLISTRPDESNSEWYDLGNSIEETGNTSLKSSNSIVNEHQHIDSTDELNQKFDSLSLCDSVKIKPGSKNKDQNDFEPLYMTDDQNYSRTSSSVAESRIEPPLNIPEGTDLEFELEVRLKYHVPKLPETCYMTDDEYERYLVDPTQKAAALTIPEDEKPAKLESMDVAAHHPKKTTTF